MKIFDDKLKKLAEKEYAEIDALQKKYEKSFIIERKKAELRKQKNELREIKNSNRYYADRRKKFTTSKLLMYLILVNSTIVEVYSMWIMFYLKDLSALYSLIGAVLGESLSYAIYCAKSFHETKEEVRSQLERDKFNAENHVSDDDIPEEFMENQ